MAARTRLLDRAYDAAFYNYIHRRHMVVWGGLTGGYMWWYTYHPGELSRLSMDFYHQLTGRSNWYSAKLRSEYALYPSGSPRHPTVEVGSKQKDWWKRWNDDYRERREREAEEKAKERAALPPKQY